MKSGGCHKGCQGIQEGGDKEKGGMSFYQRTQEPGLCVNLLQCFD